MTISRKYLPILIGAALALGLILILVIRRVAGHPWPSWTGLSGKTIWDFAQLVIVPISLAIIAYLFSNMQRNKDREIARAQREQDLQIAEERRKADRDIASNREQEDALQAYLTAMTGLLLEHDLTDKKVAMIARARTMSLLPRLDGNRRSTLLRFLAGANLISMNDPFIDLAGADLSGMQNGPVSLYGVSLRGANLSNSNLAGSMIRDSSLRGANLSDVDLTDSDLFRTDFCNANLAGTIFLKGCHHFGGL